jgi:hypothetical protein
VPVRDVDLSLTNFDTIDLLLWGEALPVCKITVDKSPSHKLRISISHGAASFRKNSSENTSGTTCFSDPHASKIGVKIGSHGPPVFCMRLLVSGLFPVQAFAIST